MASTEVAAENPGLCASLSSAWRVATQGSVVSSIFILLTTCVGAGTLSLPYGFARGGLVFSSIVFFIIMVSCDAIIKHLLKRWSRTLFLTLGCYVGSSVIDFISLSQCTLTRPIALYVYSLFCSK